MRGHAGAETTRREEPEDAEAVVHGHDDGVVVIRERSAVVVAALAPRVSATVEPHHHRPLGVFVVGV